MVLAYPIVKHDKGLTFRHTLKGNLLKLTIMKNLNLFTQFSQKKSVVFLLVSVFLAIGLSSIHGQEITLDNYSGEWTDNASWIDSTSPGIFADGVDIEVYGYISHEDNLTYDDGTITIHDTLVIHGNLSLLNSAILTIDVSGILMVDGDYYSENKVEVTSGGTLIVTGEFSMVGAEDQGSFINDGSIFIFDDDPEIKSGDDFIDLQCDDPSDYPANCAYGDEIDISVDPVGELFTDVTCTKYDTIAPVLVLPALSPVTSPSDIPAAYSNYNAMIADGGSATDDCNINKASFIHISDVSDSNTCPEIITRTYAISDKAGNTTTAAQTILVIDNTAPVLTLPILPNYHCINDLPVPYSNYTELEADGGAATDNTNVDFNTLILLSEDTFFVGEWTAVSRTYEIADLCGNAVTSVQDILIKDNMLPFLTCPPDITLCAGNSLGAVADNIDLISCSDNCTSEGDLLLTYTITGATITSGTGNASGEFFNVGVSVVTYTIADEAGNASSDSFTVTVNPKPITNDIIGIGSPLCEASSEMYTIIADSTSDYLWTVPSDADIVSDTSGTGVTEIEVNFGFNSGYLTVTETNTFGCTGDAIKLEIGLVGCPVIADFDMDKSSLCLYDSVLVWSTSVGISEKTIYNWDFGTDAQPAFATGPGPHSVLFGSEGNKSIQLTVEETSIESAAKTIEVNGLASNILGPDQEICEGDSYVFTPDISCSDYIWHDGSNLEEYIAESTQTVSVTVVDENGCIVTDSADILVRPNPVIDLGADRQVCATEGEQITVEEFAFYEWSTGDVSSSLTVFPDAGTISLTVTDWYNCTGSDELTILPCSNINALIDIPNVVSPNGDGIQDTWFIPGLENYPDARIDIYDLYGRRIFHTENGYENDWNATYNGIQLPIGRYFYIIDLQSPDIQPQSGAISIVR